MKDPSQTLLAGPEVHLRGDVWAAVTDFRAGPAGRPFDLETLRPWNPRKDAHALEEQPERFLQLPDAGLEYQRALGLLFAAELPPAQRAGVEAALATPEWRNPLLSALDQAGLRAAWESRRQSVVVDLVLTWADRHGIPRQRLVSPRRARPEGVEAKVSAGLGTDASEIRAALHQLIDCLSDDEVVTFPVPGWALTRRGR